MTAVARYELQKALLPKSSVGQAFLPGQRPHEMLDRVPEKGQ